MRSSKPNRNTWLCNPTSPKVTSSQGTHIRRRTAELVRVTGSYLSVRPTSRESPGLASPGGDNRRSSISHPRKFKTEGQSIVDASSEQNQDVFEHDFKEDVDIVEDRGNNLRIVHQTQESDISEEESKNGEEELGESLSNARVNATGGQFIPRHALEKLLTEQNVRKELHRSLPEIASHELDDLVKTIWGHSDPGDTNIESTGGTSHSPGYRRIFAVLVLIDRSADIQRFIDSGISDKDLPLSKTRLQQAHIGSIPAKIRPLRPNDWTKSAEERFEAQQWELIVPFFSKSDAASKVRFYQLNEKDILPFITDNPDHHTTGGFGTVTKIRIHPSHHSFDNNHVPNGVFALKEIRSHDRNEWAQEVNALQKFNFRNQSHLTSLLATFKHGDTYYLMFPWAEGDLRHYWKTYQLPHQLNVHHIRWVAKQMLGIAKGLYTIHRLDQKKFEGEGRTRPEIKYGRHGDLKPENILVYKDENSPSQFGNLKITDFGLTRFVTSASGLHKEQRVTPTYRAPEYDIDRGVTTQAYDIWSLGCLYLEFITWVLMGSHGVDEKFTAARTILDGPQEAVDDSYFIVKKDDITGLKRAEVKPSVTEWIGMLRQQPNVTPFLQSMLDIIGNKMLVVDVKARIDAKRCVSALEEAASQIGTGNPYRTSRVAQRALPGIGEYKIQNKLRDKQSDKASMYKNNITSLRLEKLDTASYRASAVDRLRLWIERYFGHQIDWSPLPPVDRRQATSKARLIWEYGGREISIFLNHRQFKRYRNRIRASNPGILPTTNTPQSASLSTTLPNRITSWQSFYNNVKTLSRFWRRNGGVKCHTAATKPASNTTGNTQKESYFCTDKYWTNVKQTNMYTVPLVDSLTDDYELFLRLRESLTTAQGSWLSRLLSCRSCTQVQLSKFTFLFDNNDLVKVFERKADKKSQEICKGYEYLRQPGLELDEHMQLMAETILQGLQEPELGLQSCAVLDGIPKLQAPPGLNKKQHNSGWGFYATQGLSMKKILGWVAGILLVGIAFVPIWLATINAVDLQNAFTPVSFLASLVTIILGITAMFVNL